MSTRSRRSRQSAIDTSPSRIRKGVSPSVSPARTQKSSAPRSPSRRSPSRRSPSRKATTYPVRKSPSRAVKEKNEKDIEEVPRSPAKRPALKKEAELRLYDISSTKETFRSTRTRRSEYSVRDIPETVANVRSMIDEKLNGFEASDSITELYNLRNRKTVDETGPRRSSRLREFLDPSEIRRSFSKSMSKSISKSISTAPTFSDEENLDELPKERKSESVTRKLSTPLPSIGLSQFNNKLEFGGRIGTTLLIFLIPLVVFAILLSCRTTCSWKVLTALSIQRIALIDKDSIILVLAQYTLQALLIMIPLFGTKVEKDGQNFCFNGFFSSFCTLSILSSLDYYKIINSNTFVDKTLQMAVIAYVVAIIISLILFMKHCNLEEDLNPYGHPQYALYNFFIGKEIHSTILNVNIKLWLSRVCNITALILSISVFKSGISFKENIEIVSVEDLYKLTKQINLKPTLLIYAMMQIIYALNFLMREYKITATFYWQSEGLGYLQVVSSALYPYYFVTISKYVAKADLSLPANVLIAACALYALGFLIMLISNNIKYNFRKNPLHPSLTHLDSMPTFHGKKLLVSNLWGFLRHPNYAGDILIHAAFAIPGIYSQQVLAAAPAILTIAVLLHRAWRDHGRCKRRYGAAWTRYCKRVPSMVIPKIF
ncbi:delta(14)-sterol reductase TM7SF2 [Aricia agestis]|uniref:delta(14)-sterol reductase TM7SF2 n=1 Tax=Aricia agestis TaxID=91739 RepID=UPI001C20A949|nr:delta(14)-sterol reductase TM7SF2 [Aricia agestis]